MLKRYVSLFLFSIAILLIIGHDIIPHKHSVDSTYIDLELIKDSDHFHHHHHHHHHENLEDAHQDVENNEEESSGLGALFSNFVHAGFYLFQSENETNRKAVKKKIPKYAFKLFLYGRSNEDNKLLMNQQSNCWYDDPIYLSTHSLSSGLRAPPVFPS